MKTNVGVFFGGRSVEHEISVISALQAIHALNKDKYTVTPIYISKQGKWYTGNELLEVDRYRNMDSLLKSCTEVYLMPEYGNNQLYRKKKGLFGSDVVAALDVALPVLHGTNGEDGSFQGVLELAGIPYAGCNPLASANGMDKITMKMILKESSIPVIDYIWFSDKDWFSRKTELIREIENKLGYPVIVKPANLGSSVGISHGNDQNGLIAAVELAERFSTRIVVEKMISDLKEINCSVLGNYEKNTASVCEEPIRSGEILSYSDKYMSGGKSSKGMQSTKRRIPAELPEAVSEEIRRLASKTFEVLSCNGVSRVDFILDNKNNTIFVNEINTIPGSLSFYLWEASGLPFDRLLDELISLAFKRDRESKMKVVSYDQNIFSLKGGFKSGKA